VAARAAAAAIAQIAGYLVWLSIAAVRLEKNERHDRVS
jgi:hypothetical protein